MTSTDVFPFSSSDSEWPLMATLTWISTRSLKMTEAFALRDVADVASLIATSRQACGTPLNLDLGSSFNELCKRIASAEIGGVATIAEWRVPAEHEGCSPEDIEAMATLVGRSPRQAFRPDGLRNANYPDRYEMGPHDFVLLRESRVVPKGSGAGSPNEDGSRTRWSWENVAFQREDVMRTWPESGFFSAWKKAKAKAKTTTWVAPSDLSPTIVDRLSSGNHVGLGDAVDLLAFGADMKPVGLDDLEARAQRLCAGLALMNAATSGEVEIYGHATYRMPDFPPYGIAPMARLWKIDRDVLGGSTLVIDGARDWLGPRRFADEYPEVGIAPESVTHAGVSVHKASFRDWIAKIANAPAPKKRGRKNGYDWGAIHSEMIRLMDHHGDFTGDDPEWNAQARLEAALQSWHQEQFGRDLGRTQLQKNLRSWLPTWQADRAAR